MRELQVVSIDVILKLLLFHLVTDERADGTHFVAFLVLRQLFSADAREDCQAVLALRILWAKGISFIRQNTLSCQSKQKMRQLERTYLDLTGTVCFRKIKIKKH